MTEAQLVGKWLCDASIRRVSDGEYKTISTIEYRSDHTYQGVVSRSFSRTDDVVGFLEVRLREEGTWRIDGDEIEVILLVSDPLSTSNPQFGPDEVRALDATLPPGDGVYRELIRGFDGRRRTMDDTGFLGRWTDSPWACTRI